VKYEVRDRVKVKNEFDIYEEYRDKQFVIEECDSSDDTYLCHPTTGGYRIWFSEEKLEPVVSTLAKIKEKELTCCINVRSIVEAQFLDDFFECKSYLKKYCENAYKERMRLWYCRTLEEGVAFQLTDGVINDCCSANFYKSCGGRYGEVYEFSDLFPVGSTMVCDDRMCQRTESGITNYKLVPKYKEGRDENHFCNGFRGGKKPTYVNGGLVRIHDVDTHELWTTPFIIPKDKLDALVDAWAKLGCTTFNLVSDEVKEVIKKTEEKKMPTKFTFYVKEGTRIDKSCNKTVPTMTTFVSIGRYHSGKATCDKADYDERQGCLEAIANAFLDGNFDREFNKAVKKSERTELHNRTCTYCGKVCDTVKELKEHEAWHVERKKARRERYLLRKRAKEIAFEEAAQKMAKEIIAENKKEAK
jgi:hypothetical protein